MCVLIAHVDILYNDISRETRFVQLTFILGWRKSHPHAKVKSMRLAWSWKSWGPAMRVMRKW